MPLVNDPQNSNSLFSSASKIYNINQQSSEDLRNIMQSLNIIDPDQLSKEELSIILKRIDDYNGFFTTQQLQNIDYYKFNNHVFFDSAVSKVSYSFDRIQNKPYDKDELENIKYNNKTDGYTQFLLENIFPKSKGFARFSGKEKIVMYDQQGKVIKDSATRKIGILNPLNNRFSIDFWLNVHSDNFVNNQVIFKKFENTDNKQNGFICYVSEGTLESNCYINFLIFIDGLSTSSKCLIEKDLWQNVVISVSNSNGKKKTSFIISGNIVEEENIINSGSKLRAKSFGVGFKNINIPLVLGGIFVIESDLSIKSTLTIDNIHFNNFNGDIDEFRLFHRVRSIETIKKEMHKNIYSQKGLKIYLRLNEPAGNYQNSCLIIDYSGNKLHGLIYKKDDENSNHYVLNDTSNMKINKNTPLQLERDIDSPVLNSSYSKTISIREKLISLAKEYDNQNPNLIFNLLPRHYFLNSSDLQNLPVFSNDEKYTLPSSIITDDSGKILDATTLTPVVPANSDLVNIVLIWARFFDQLKMYIASIANFLNVDYDSINKHKIVGMQIPILCKMYGIKFKELLPSPTKQKLNNENLNYEDILSNFSIRKIQNILWQRFLINTQDFLRSKGTINSIKSTFRSFGIDYTKFIDIKEFATFNDVKKENNYSIINLKKNTADFNSKEDLNLLPVYENEQNDDYTQNKLYFLIENIRSQVQKSNNVTTSAINGLGLSWSVELFFAFKNQLSSSISEKQCLFRINVESSAALIVSYEKYKYSDLGKITVNIQPIKNNDAYNKSIDILDINIFDLPKYFCISQEVNLDNNTITYSVTVDDIGNQIKIKDAIKQKSIISDSSLDIANAIDQGNFSFHNQALSICTGNYNYANNNMLSVLLSTPNDTNFQGEILKVRLWNKSLNNNEIKSHIKNINNIGTDDNLPLKHIISDFEINSNKSIELNNTKQWLFEDISNNLVMDANTNTLASLNSCKLLTRNLTKSDRIISFREIICKESNTNIDSPVMANRVNIASYSDEENKLLANNFTQFPSNNIPVDFKYDAVSRVSIDMSIAKLINSDISNVISDLNEFTKTISNNNSIFEYSYKDLESLRDSYFEKYSDNKMINYSSIGNVFKYFDNIMSSILYDIVPNNVRFEGFNLVYESHSLERHKYQHKYKHSYDSIVDDNNYASFSREYLQSRRSISYNNNRRLV